LLYTSHPRYLSEEFLKTSRLGDPHDLCKQDRLHNMSGIDCQPCGRHFRLHAHYEDHRIHSAQHHYCAPCRRDFVSEHAKQNHLLHSEKHQLCKWCQTPLGKLRTHNQNHHEQCTECGEWCENAATLHRHYTFDHSDVYCAPCKRLFRRPNELHMVRQV
jgi:hypothetical protein